ncbi:hypothetical protein KLL03_16800, partial [Clostridioides difficile]|nr:hypothetical protein [Clostridioides difficile]
ILVIIILITTSQSFISYGLDRFEEITIFHTNDIHGRYAEGDEFTNTKIIDLHGREFVIIIYKNCLEELLRKCANGGISNDNN